MGSPRGQRRASSHVQGTSERRPAQGISDLRWGTGAYPGSSRDLGVQGPLRWQLAHGHHQPVPQPVLSRMAIESCF